MKGIARILIAVVLASVLSPVGFASAGPGRHEIAVQSVEMKAYPQVRLRLILPSAMLSKTRPRSQDFEVLENGRKRVAEVRPLDGERRPLSVVLVVDTSGSMRGRPLDDAKRAAIQFVGLMRPEDKIALVAFSSKPVVAASFRSSRSRVVEAIKGLKASGETALYDAIYTASRLTSGSKGPRSILLLTDGKDSASSTNRAEAVAALRRWQVPVLSVGLQSGSFEPEQLTHISSASGGRFVLAKDSAGLRTLYERIAREIRHQYEVSYESAKPTTKQLTISVQAKVNGDLAEMTTVVGNPAKKIEAPRPAFPSAVLPQAANPSLLAIMILLTAASVGFLIFGIIGLFTAEPTALEQIAFYDQLRQQQGADEQFWGVEGETEGVKSAMMEAVGYVAGRRGITAGIHRKLEQAGLPLRPLEYMLFHILTVLAVGGSAALLLDNTGLSIVLVLISTVLPIVLLEMKIDRRRTAFRGQLPEVLNMLAGSLRAGYGLLQAVGLVVQESPAPASVEFRRVQTEASLGLSLENALEKMADRMESEDFRWTVGAINVQREVGGNLAEVLDIIAETIRERDGLMRHIKSLTADGRLSAIILLALPFVEAAVLYVVNPSYMSVLIENPLGITLVIAALVLILLGTMWLRKIIAIEV
ncbi:MAG: VWA domain-containing protein [Actinobacteria bacterium]|nr:MAG: VWA domain-containing protein [Actinomycetota bacterium]